MSALVILANDHCSPPQAQATRVHGLFWKNPPDTSDFSSFPLKPGPELEVAIGLSSLVLKVRGEVWRVYLCSGWIHAVVGCRGLPCLLSLPDLR